MAFARELVSVHEATGLSYVSAPELGHPDVAAKGELNALAGGPPDAVAPVRSLLDVIGGRIWDMGQEPPTANAPKIACNMTITMVIEAMAEAVVLTEANGLSRERFFDVILNTLFGSRSYQIHSAKIAQGNYEPGFKAEGLALASEAAEETGRASPMLPAVHGGMADTFAAGMGERDWPAMAKFAIESSDLRVCTCKRRRKRTA